MRRRGCQLGILFIALTCYSLSRPASLNAQRFRLFHVTANSSQPELPTARGFGLGASLPLPFRINVEVGWKSIEDATARTEDLCFSYNPKNLCEQGVALRETTL